jgi:hypothetical protein
LSGREDRKGIELEWARAEAEGDVSEDSDVPRRRLPPALPRVPRAGTAPTVNRMQIASSEIASRCDARPAIGASVSRAMPTVAFAAITPNPSRAGFEIRFTGSVAGPVSLAIYDPTGRRVRTVIEDELRPGVHIVVWDGRDGAGRMCAGGIYFAALRHAGDVNVARLLLLR